MKLILLLFLFFFEFTSFAQDTLLLVGRKYYENDSLVRSTVMEYDDRNLSVYSISVNYKRRDTTEIFTHYDNERRIIMGVVNGPYYRDVWDTTRYEYRHDTMIIIQKDKHRYFRMEKDGLDRRILSLSETYDDTGRVLKRTIDSIFYDDEANIQVSRSYLMENYPVSRNYDDDFPFIEPRDQPSQKKKNELSLRGTTLIIRDEQGNALEMVIQLESGFRKDCKYEHDSLGRTTRTEIECPDEKIHDLTEYEYHISGDTLIRTVWKTDLLGDGIRKKRSVSYSSVEKVNDRSHWSLVFVEGELTHEGYVVFNEEGLILKDFRRNKQDDGNWVETTIIHTYKKFEKF